MPFGFPSNMEVPNITNMTFNHVDQRCSSFFDERLLNKFIPSVKAQDSAFIKFIDVFGRIVKYGQIICCQYLFVWNGQLFPPHPMDYEPVFVFLNRRLNEKWIAFDKKHYDVGRYYDNISADVWMDTNYFWHSFKIRHSHKYTTTFEIKPLVDEYLDHWWNLNDSRAKLVIDETLKKPSRASGVNTFRDIAINLRDKVIDWIKYGFFHYIYNSETLEQSIMRLYDGIVVPARRILSNPGYLEVTAGFIELVYTLEKYHLVTIESSLKEHLHESKQISTDSTLSDIYGNLLKEWEIGSVESTDYSYEYMNELQKGMRLNTYLVGLSKKWLLGFKQKLSKSK